MFRKKQTKRSLFMFLLALAVVAVFGLPAAADTVESTAVAVTQSDDYDTSPTLGADATSEMVVYTLMAYDGGGYGSGNIMCQRLNADGTTSGDVIQVSDGTTDDQLNDVYGSRIVYTAFESVSSPEGKIMLYDLATQTTVAIMSEVDAVREARIHGDVVVWVQGQSGDTRVNYFDLNWPSGTMPVTIGGPNPPCANVDIGSRYVVWEQRVDGQDDIAGYGIYGGDYISVSADPDLDERTPATFGEYIVWQANHPDGSRTIEIADMSVEPADRYTAVDNGSLVFAPSIYGNVVAYEARREAGSDLNIYLYRISDMADFTLTDQPDDQYLNNIFGDKVAYVDTSGVGMNVWVSTFNFVSDQPVYFADANLKAAVEAALEIDDPTPTDMLSLTSLWASDGDIVFLTGLQYATNLTKVHLEYNNISNLSPLSGLTNLRNVYLSYNEISNLVPISGLTDLFYLDLSYNQISDLSPLSGLTNLYLLNLENNPLDCLAYDIIETIEANNPDAIITYDRKPENCDDVVYFADANLKAAVEEALGITDPTVSNMLLLTELDATNSEISDLTGLEYATNLTRLRLDYNQISDISPLAGLANLVYLYINANDISDLSPISGLLNLTVLELGGNQISDLSSISGLTNLTRLSLNNNQITDITPLSDLTFLLTLWLSYNQISDLPDLSGLTNLTSLGLASNDIMEILDLSGLTSLEILYLHDNEISGDISGLSGLTNLTSLGLGSNDISDISPISALTNLTVLWLDNNQISDISPISDFETLGYLYLHENPLDCLAYDIYIPQIVANNPGIDITYDPKPGYCDNQPPVADAGPDQDIFVPGTTVQLDGTGSYDLDEEDEITYSWTMLSKPDESSAELDVPTSATPTFVPDIYGTYVIELLVSDEWSDSEPDTVIVSLENIMPVADAGPDQTVHVGTVVTLDGSASSDPDENYPLSYLWEFASMPAGSMAELTDADTVNPSFGPDLMGDYIVELVVTDSLGRESEPDTVLVSTTNTAPVADAADDQLVIELGTLVQLDGTQSWDDDGDDITYLWSIIQSPAESEATLDDDTLADPTFVADVQGEYIIELLVSDSWDTSAPDSVLVSFDNIKPVANAGGNQGVVAGNTVLLDGSGSFDANLDMLTYNWTFISMPQGSVAVFTDPTSVQTDFLADEVGEYRISLVVNDGLINSSPDNITILAVASDNPITQILLETINVINLLPGDVFKNENMRDSLTRFISDAIEAIDNDLYGEALSTLEGILPKIDGCANSDPPEYENDDWIRDCDAQYEVYSRITEAITLLEESLGG